MTKKKYVLAEGEPAYRRLVEQIRISIINGKLAAGGRLPTSRQIASETGLSRNTVLAALDQLKAEGYIEGHRGSGTYVRSKTPDEMTRPEHLDVRKMISSDSTSNVGLSRRGSTLAELPRLPVSDLSITTLSRTAFRIGIPALDQFPADTWWRIYSAHARRANEKLTTYYGPAGFRPLREAIAGRLAITRGIRCSPDQVIIVSSSQSAFDLCLRLLLDPGDPVWLEDPGFLGARLALTSAGAKIVPVPVDNEGIEVAVGISRRPDARLALVTPSQQFPLGITMSIERRYELLNWAARSGAWVIEYDHDCEFTYRNGPFMALQAIDRHERVIYIGTFRKAMFPSLRLAYIVLPSEIVEPVRAVHLPSDVHHAVAEQSTMAEFMSAGHFDRHLRKMRVVYEERHRLLVEAAKSLEPALTIKPADGGLHVLAQLSTEFDDAVVSSEAADRGIHAWPLSMHVIEYAQPPALVLGYAGVRPSDIPNALGSLKAALFAAANKERTATRTSFVQRH